MVAGVAAAALVAGATGCSDDGDDGGSDAERSGASEDGARDAASDEGTAEGAADADDAGDPAGSGGSTNGGESSGGAGTRIDVDRTFTGDGSEQFCAELERLEGLLPTGSDPAATDYAEVAEAMATIEPPVEITAEWSLIAEVQQRLLDQLERGSDDPVGAIEQGTLDQFGLASAVVARYAVEVCGF
jgi:hypothetical protein